MSSVSSRSPQSSPGAGRLGATRGRIRQPAARALAAILPFAGVAVTASVPFAAALYLAASAVWGALERPVLTRLIAR